MKNAIKNSLLFAAFGALAACSADDGAGSAAFGPDREITVRCAGTRTTVEYEGSDVSHLVWQDGDRVAYVTDAAGDKFRTADVVSNRFSATVPAGAGTLVALWPAAGNEGVTLPEASAELKTEIPQTVGEKFDGSLLPMFARAEIPADGKEVDALYEPLGVIVRLTIDMFGHDTEILRSVTLSAEEDMVGTFAVDPSSETGWSFTGTSKSVKAVFSGDTQVGEVPFHVYMVVRRGAYTGVTVTVETDANIYEVTGGEMSLDRDGRVLYRIEVPALEERPKPTVFYFTEVANASELTTDGKYLFVAVSDNADEYIADQFVVESNNAYMESVKIVRAEEGVLYDENTEPLMWALKDAGDGKFNLQSVQNGYYAGSPLARMLQPWYVDNWPLNCSLWLEEKELAGYGERSRWDIVINADGEAFIYSMELVDSDNVRWWLLYNKPTNRFCVGKEGYGYQTPMKILKLRE